MADHELATYKRIILCADGTWLESDQGENKAPSNVAKIARSLASTGLDADGKKVKQIVYYHAGLGSGDLPFQKALSGAIGWGLSTDVTQIYDFVSNNFEAGDEIIMFGFSRGAFTVRSAAGLICDVGVLSATSMARFPELWKEYTGNISGPFKETAWYKENAASLGLVNTNIKCVGVYDTVGALGVPEYPWVTAAEKWGVRINQRYKFHNTSASKYIEHAFQALSIDEERLTFPPTLWHKTMEGPSKDLRQCWFPGVHQNVGGQEEWYESKSDHGQLGFISLGWMIDCVSPMLTFEEEAIKEFIQEHHHCLNRVAIPNGWGCGPIVGNFIGVWGKAFLALGKDARKPGQYPEPSASVGKQFGGETNETFHPCVRIRQMRLPEYEPAALRGFTPEAPHGTAGLRWTKKGVTSIPEYVMRPEIKLTVTQMQASGVVGFTTMDSLSRLMCPADILTLLDRENGIYGEPVEGRGPLAQDPTQ